MKALFSTLLVLWSLSAFAQGPLIFSVPRNGNAATYLDGTGALSTPAGMGSSAPTNTIAGNITANVVPKGSNSTNLVDGPILISAVTNVAIAGVASANAGIFTNGITSIPVVTAYGASTTVDFSGAGDLWIVLGGNLTLSSSNLGAGRAVTLRIDNQTATNCSVILPTTWRFVSGTTNNILATAKVGLLSVKSYAANDTNCVALWSSE